MRVMRMCVEFLDEILLKGGGGVLISVENRKFSRSRMTKRIERLNSSCEI